MAPEPDALRTPKIVLRLPQRAHCDGGGKCIRSLMIVRCEPSRATLAQKCTITPSGYCASIDKYDPSLDYRRNASGADNYFPSTNTTYCEYGDQTCSQCRATVFRESIDGSDNPSQFCVGYRGCVCVGFCESSVWKPVVVDMLCEQASSNTIGPYRTALTGPLRTIAFIVVLIITIPVVLVVGNSMRCKLRLVHQSETVNIIQQILTSLCGHVLSVCSEGVATACATASP